MAILTSEESRAILEKAMKLSKAEECEANLNGTVGGNIRYALNTVTTAGASNDTTLVVQSSFGKKVGAATINEFDDASIEKTVRRSEELARLAPENPEWIGVEGPHKYTNGNSWYDNTAGISPEYRARAAADSIRPAKKNAVIAAGFLEDNASTQAMMNSRGLFAYHRSTTAEFTITMRSEDGTGSGWVARNENDLERLDTGGASSTAMDKALRSRDAKALEPGKYTVILEPSASAGLLSAMMGAFDGRLADEGRSFLSAEGGANKLGEKVFDERVRLYSDPLSPDVPMAGWAQDGRPRKKIHWVDGGVVKNLYYQSRFWAKQKGVDPTPPPANLIMEGGKESLEELVAGTERGILVTRTWYIRPLDPQTQLYTGLTRDGTFYIENGKIRHPVKNFRFNDSPVIMLNNLEALGRPQRVPSWSMPLFIPPMRLREFNFSSLSDAV